MLRLIQFCATLALFVLAAGRIGAGPPLREEAERREKITADLKAALAGEATTAGKATALRRAYQAEAAAVE